MMTSTASESSPPSPGAAAFLDDHHALFLDDGQSTSSFFPATTTSPELLPPPPAAAARKPPRKRPRASRRPPTTVVTTDTSNFRAMVQEFTGIPAPPPFAAPAPHHLVGPAAGAAVLFGAPHHHDPTARAPLDLLRRPSPLKLPAAAQHPPDGSSLFAHSLFASSSSSSSAVDPAAGSSSAGPYGGFPPTLSGSGAVARYDGGGGFDAAEDERVGHGHAAGFFSSFLHSGNTYHSH